MPVISPGTGPVPDATEPQAAMNMRAFAGDLARHQSIEATGFERSSNAESGGGRWAYTLHLADGRHIDILMPGAPLQHVEEGYHRVYVDGSSWDWEYALRQCAPPDTGSPTIIPQQSPRPTPARRPRERRATRVLDRPEPADTQLAVIYCRMSEDREGGGLGIDRQREDCEQLAASLGLKVFRVYSDNDLSAYSGKPRPDYQRMLNDLRAGVAGNVIAWHTDRLHRRPVELEEYIDVCEPRRIETRTVKAGDIDLTTASGRMIARQLGVHARYEVERMIERQKRAREQKVARGEYCGGPRPYGWEEDGVTPVAEEISVIREACEAILAGASARSIAADLNRRERFTSTGAEWEGGSLVRMLKRPRNAGIIQFRGDEGGASKWDAAVDEPTWRSVLKVLNDPSRIPTASNVRKWLGGNLYECGVCGATMKSHHPSSAKVPRPTQYRCRDGSCVIRNAPMLDQHVQHLLLRRLQRPDARDLFATIEPVADASGAQASMREARALLDDLAGALGRGEMDMQEWRAASAGAKERLRMAEAKLSTAVQVNPLARLFGASDVEAEWERMDLSMKRAAIDFAMTVRVMPAVSGRKAGGSYWDPSAIEIVWK